MIQTHRTVFKWFWAWQDEAEEAWLEQMALDGWHLVAIPFLASYRFEKGEPQRKVFRLDFISSRKDYNAYRQLFQDSGWDHLGEMGGWQYFCKAAAPGETPEIYTDTASKAQKFNRVMLFLIILLPVNLFMLMIPVGSDFYAVFRWMAVFLIFFYIFGLVKIFLRRRELTDS